MRCSFNFIHILSYMIIVYFETTISNNSTLTYKIKWVSKQPDQLLKKQVNLETANCQRYIVYTRASYIHLRFKV